MIVLCLNTWWSCRGAYLSRHCLSWRDVNKWKNQWKIFVSTPVVCMCRVEQITSLLIIWLGWHGSWWSRHCCWTAERHHTLHWGNTVCSRWVNTTSSLLFSLSLSFQALVKPPWVLPYTSLFLLSFLFLAHQTNWHKMYRFKKKKNPFLALVKFYIIFMKYLLFLFPHGHHSFFNFTLKFCI